MTLPFFDLEDMVNDAAYHAYYRRGRAWNLSISPAAALANAHACLALSARGEGYRRTTAFWLGVYHARVLAA